MADKKGLERKLAQASSMEEVKVLAAEAGLEMSDETARQILGKFTVSPDELEAMSGGETVQVGCDAIQYRSRSAQGCAATVEEGSDCWGVDGGCELINICYFR